MDRLQGEQLSLIADLGGYDRSPSTDWAIDTKEVEDWEYELIRREYVSRANGGQTKTLDPLIDTSGGQTNQIDPLIDTSEGQTNQIDPSLLPIKYRLKPLAILPLGISSWIEIHPRKSGNYYYQRWRDAKIKRSRYLGKSLD